MHFLAQACNVAPALRSRAALLLHPPSKFALGPTCARRPGCPCGRDSFLHFCSISTAQPHAPTRGVCTRLIRDPNSRVPTLRSVYLIVKTPDPCPGISRRIITPSSPHPGEAISESRPRANCILIHGSGWKDFILHLRVLQGKSCSTFDSSQL